MEDVEERALTTFHTPHFWKRYVDGTFMALPKELVDHFLNHLNRIEPSINFTVEKEKDGCSWMCSYAGKMMAQWVLLSTASRHTPTSICPSSPNILQHTKWLLSGH